MATPAKKRIMADIREMHEADSPMMHAAPVEDNMFDWHFTIRGPSDSPYEGGEFKTLCGITASPS